MENDESSTNDAADPENKVTKMNFFLMSTKQQTQNMFLQKILLEPYEYIRNIPGKEIRPKLIKVFFFVLSFDLLIVSFF